MEELDRDIRKLKSYVWHGDQCYFISTIERDSSSIHGGRFNETLVWEYDWAEAKSGDIVAMAGEGEAFRQHYAVAEQMYRHGKYSEDGE